MCSESGSTSGGCRRQGGEAREPRERERMTRGTLPFHYLHRYFEVGFYTFFFFFAKESTILWDKLGFK